jgi:branched-chain amino acid transport system permease protein
MLPSGVFFETHRQELGLVRTTPQRLWLVAFVLALFAVPLLASPYLLGAATILFISLIAVYGLQITVGMAGQINLGQSAFVGIGAYATAKLSLLGLPFWAALPLAGLTAGLASIVFGLPAGRVRGFYLALTTLAAQVTFPILVLRLPSSWLGAAGGLSVDPPRFLGRALSTPTDMYYLALAVALIMSLLAFNLRRSRIGRAFRAIRDNDLAAEVMGIDPLRTKLLAFLAGAVFAGVAGGLLAYYIRYVTTDQFTLWMSVWYLGMLIVGGVHTPLGAILGTVFIVALDETLHAIGGKLISAQIGLPGGIVFAATNVMLGGIIILVLVFEPRGLAHRWAMLKTAYRIWPYPRG